MNILRKCNSKNLFSFWKLLIFSLKIYSKNRSFFFFAHESKNWTLFFLVWLWLKEYFLSNMTRMELFSSKYDTKNSTFFEYDSKIRIFSKKKLTEFNLFSSNMTKELAFISWIWRTELNLFFSNLSRIELFFFFFSKYDSNISTLLENMTQRIELFISD